MHLALRARLEAVSAIPAKAYRAFENKDFTPTDGQPYIGEEFIPQGGELPSLSRGPAVSLGLYVVKWYGFQNTGITAIRRGTTAILAAFQPGDTLPPLANGDGIRIRAKPAPWAGQILPQDNGRAVCTITIPFRVQSPALAS